MQRTVVLKLEWIGEDSDAACREMRKHMRNIGIPGKVVSEYFNNPSRKPWVARITGRHPKYNWDRDFLDGKIDYRDANSKGSRGVYLVFHLRGGGVYEVRHYTSWSNEERYFCRIEDGSVHRLDESELHKHLTDAET